MLRAHGRQSLTCDFAACKEFRPFIPDNDCCAYDDDAFCPQGYIKSKVLTSQPGVTWINAPAGFPTDWRGHVCSNAAPFNGNTCCHSPLPPSPSPPPPLPPWVSEKVVSHPKVTVVLKVDMSLDAYTGDQERIKGALRAKLGCDEPLCVLQVTVTPGSVILTVVAMDTSPNSQLAVAATTTWSPAT